MTKILIILGGAWHDFEGFATTMRPMLSDAGYLVEVTDDVAALERIDQIRPGVIMLYTLRGNVSDGTRTGEDFTAAQVAALTAWVERGHGLVGIHGATVSARSNVAYHQLIGGHFESHPARFHFTVTPRHAAHPITAGVQPFEVDDELYRHDVFTDGEILAVTLYEGRMHPMLWTRRQGNGAIAYLAPGHDAKTWNLEAFRTLVLRCVEWVVDSASPKGSGPA